MKGHQQKPMETLLLPDELDIVLKNEATVGKNGRENFMSFYSNVAPSCYPEFCR